MTLQLNPTVNDPVDQRTLAQLRQYVFDGLGFLTQLTGTSASTKRTLASLRAEVKTRLGIAVANPTVTDTLVNIRTLIKSTLGLAVLNTVVTDTLANIRTDVYNACGYAAQTVHPPGIDTTINGFVNEAQQTIFRVIETDKGAVAAPAKLVADGDTTVMDRNVILQRAIGLMKTHLGMPDGENFTKESDKYLADLTSRAPPAIDSIVNGYINEAQQTLYRSIEMDFGATAAPPKLAADGDVCVLDATAITQLALGLCKTHYGKEDGKNYLEQSKKYLADRIKRGPPNIDAQVTAALQDAQRAISRRVEMQYLGSTINPFSPDLPSNLAPFAVDTDSTTFDAEPVLLLALANMKRDLSQNGYRDLLDEYEAYMAHLVKRQPPDAVSVVNRLIKDAQDALYRTYKLFRMSRWFTWTTVAGQRFYGIQADDNSSIVAPTNVVATVGSASTAANMSTARQLPAVVLLQSGRVLVAGGAIGVGDLATAEEYDPAQGTYTLVGSMVAPRSNVDAVLLPNGSVLLTGGTNGFPLATAEIYSISTKTFSQVSDMISPRNGHSTVVLKNGKILVTGGTIDGTSTPTASAEIYDPTTGVWTATGPMSLARTNHAATVLPNGKVLISGGKNASGNTYTNTAELFDPVAGTFSATGAMTFVTSLHTSTLLNTGKVLIAGGATNNPPSNIANIYDPALGTFSATSNTMSHTRASHVAAVLTSGKVLVAGSLGVDTSGDVYDPSTNAFTAVSNAAATGVGFTSAILVGGGQVLIPGGGSPAIATSILYNPVTNTFASAGNFNQGTVYYRVAARNANGSTIPSLPEASVAGVPANTAVVISWTAVASTSVVAYDIYGRTTGAEQFIASVAATATSYTDFGVIVPNGAMPTVNTTGNLIFMDGFEVIEAYASQGDNNWRKLRKGVPPSSYNGTWTGPPVFYDIRQGIEIWPPAPDATWNLRFLAQYGLLPLSGDLDQVTIDWHAVYLRALADAQRHWATWRRDLGEESPKTEQKLREYIGRLNAGRHATRRYVPGGYRDYHDPPRPLMV